MCVLIIEVDVTLSYYLTCMCLEDKFICTIKLHYWNNIGQIPHPLAVWHTQMLYTLTY